MNYNKTFTGWIDVDLSDNGKLEIEHAARLLLERGYTVDVTYTSRLKRAIRSSWMILRELGQIYKPVFKSYRLNERMYGDLEGKSKIQTCIEMGEETVQEFRSGLVARPPPMQPDHPHWHKVINRFVFLCSHYYATMLCNYVYSPYTHLSITFIHTPQCHIRSYTITSTYSPFTLVTYHHTHSRLYLFLLLLHLVSQHLYHSY